MGWKSLLFAETSGAALGAWDWGTLLAYFAVLLGLAWWVISQKNDSSKDYFLAGKKAGWLVIGASLFASNIGSEHLVGLAGTGASDGMAMAHYELHAWCLLVLGWIMVPFYERSRVFTTPEFLERRYSPSARWILTLISLVAYVFTKISVTLFAGGIVFNALFPAQLIAGVSNFWVGAVGMVLITGLYTILGGLRAVLYTELLQTFVLLGGALCVLLIGLWNVGGWSELKTTAQGADKIVGYKIVLDEEEVNASAPEVLQETVVDARGNSTRRDLVLLRPVIDAASEDLTAEERENIVQNKRLANYLTIGELSREDVAQIKGKIDPETFEERFAAKNYEPLETKIRAEIRERTDHFNLWKPNSHPKYPWFGLLFGAPIVGLWYWCTDQYIVQRTLAATDQRAARRGTIFGAYLKLTPVFLFIVPGMIAYGLAAQGKLSAEVLFDGNKAFPLMVKEMLPLGLRGIVVGGLLAALMSSLASVFNSCSTLFTMDVYQKLRPEASEARLVWVGRATTAVMVILGLLWIPTISLIEGTLYTYLQSVQSYLAPPIAAVFFLGVFSKRINAQGCMAGLIGGFFLGMSRLTLEIIHRVSPFSDGSFLQWYATTSYTFMCIYLTIICVLLIVLVSLFTPKPRAEQLEGLTYSTATPEQKKATRESWNKLDIILTVGLLLSIVATYAFFTG